MPIFLTYMYYIKGLLIYVVVNLMSRPALAMLTHIKCRNSIYPRSNINRFPVPDEKINWSVEFSDYTPPTYNAASIIGKPWADLDISDPNFKVKWNALDANVNRISYLGSYQISDRFPLNPIGRTGLCGRGVLGRWGPNHAADPVVTRWKKLENEATALHEDAQKPVLQFVAIKRRDTGEWALPGGMVDPGEHVTQTAVREFQEEATNSLTMTANEKKIWQEKFDIFFNQGDEVYKGYVDDPRNTDNAWMETVAYNFHDENGTTVGKLNLHAGDDAVGVQWVDATSKIKLYASHKDIVHAVVVKRKAHW